MGEENRHLVPKPFRRLMAPYIGSSFIRAYQARFVFYFSLVCTVLLLVVILYTTLIQLMKPSQQTLNLPLLVVELSLLFCFFGILVLLAKGHAILAAHLLICAGLSAVWVVMFLDRGTAVTRLDSIVFVLGILSITPLMVQRRSALILIYTLINIPILWLFMFSQRDLLGLNASAFSDYLADVTVTLIFMGVTCFTVFTMNRQAQDRLRQDIRKRKKAEKALLESRQRIELAIQGADLGTYDWDVTTGNVIVNERYAQMRGYQLEEISNNINDWVNYVHPDDQATARKKMWDHLKGRSEFYEMEYRTTHKSGEWVWVLDRARVTERDKDGLALRVSGTHLDITERKLAEDALKESERKYRLLADNVTDNIFVMTWPDLEYTYVSPSVERIWGYTAEEFMAMTLADILTPESLKYAMNVLQEELSLESHGADASRTRTVQLEAFHKNGSKVWVETTTTGLRDKEGRLTGILGIARDITERRKFQAQLQQSQKMEAIGTLAGGIAHDFNNLLQAINGYCELLMMDKTGNEPEYKSLNEIYESSNRASELVRQLLLFSRKADFARKPVELNHEVENARKMLERIIPKMVNIEVHTDGELWQVMADPVQIEQILLNLGTNAADAMPQGGRLVIETQNVTIDNEYCQNHLGAQPGKYVLLTVSDTGHGISREIKEKIFEPFFTTKEYGKGTGLGLASVYGVVKAHGGYIMCYSEVDMGTIFKIYLPATEKKQKELVRKITLTPPKGGSETILIVDDERSIRDLAAEVLLKFGYSPLTAASGEEALEIYSNRRDDIDLVLIDLGMPGMGGHKCLEELLKINPNIKVIVASGYSIKGQVQDTMEAGAREFVGKPFKIQELLGKVRDVLDFKSV